MNAGIDNFHRVSITEKNFLEVNNLKMKKTKRGANRKITKQESGKQPKFIYARKKAVKMGINPSKSGFAVNACHDLAIISVY